MYYTHRVHETCRGGRTTQKAKRFCLDFSARAGLNVFPYEISSRSELGSPDISGKIWGLQPPPSSAHRVPPVVYC